jgi:hypothetical protein
MGGGGERALSLQTPPVMSDEHQWVCGGAWLGVQRCTPVYNVGWSLTVTCSVE